jgi:hypothetical protein
MKCVIVHSGKCENYRSLKETCCLPHCTASHRKRTRYSSKVRELQMSHSPEFAWSNYGNRQVLGQDTLFMTGVPTEYLPHNSVTRNLFSNRLSEYGEEQVPTTGRASRAVAWALRSNRDNWKDGVSQPKFPCAKECLRKLSVIWAPTPSEAEKV